MQVSAQELQPRAYWPAPNGTNVLAIGYQYSSGDVVTDPTLPLTGVDSRVNVGQINFQRTFSLFDRTANIQIAVPYIESSTAGFVEGAFRERNLSAFGDSQVRLAVNLRGAPSMNREEFQALRAKPRTIIGASIVVKPPTGAYDEDRLINAGTNRWATKLGLGAIFPLRPTWLFEADLGVWFFGDNDEFLGQTRKQEPITATEFHLIKRIRPGFWASLDANFYYGGETTVGPQRRADLQRNSRFGATLVYPFRGHHALRFSWSTGLVTESGGDYDTYALNYFYAW